MKYFYLKFGRSNIQLNYWLDKNENIFKAPTAVIYFGKYTSEDFKDFFEYDVRIFEPEFSCEKLLNQLTL